MMFFQRKLAKGSETEIDLAKGCEYTSMRLVYFFYHKKKEIKLSELIYF
jgi:hypothetical protein